MVDETSDPDERVLEDQKLVAERKDHIGNPVHPHKEDAEHSRETDEERRTPARKDLRGDPTPGP